jgi:hypothetical protein
MMPEQGGPDPFKDRDFGQDYAFFDLPPIDPAYGQPLLLEG